MICASFHSDLLANAVNPFTVYSSTNMDIWHRAPINVESQGIIEVGNFVAGVRK